MKKQEEEKRLLFVSQVQWELFQNLKEGKCRKTNVFALGILCSKDAVETVAKFGTDILVGVSPWLADQYLHL